MDVSNIQSILPAGGVNYGAVPSQTEAAGQSKVPPVQDAQGKEKKSANVDKSQQQSFTSEEVGQAVDKMNKAAQVFNTRLHFQFDDKSKELYVYVIDTASNEVLSRMPPEDIIHASSRLQNMVGLFFDKFV